MVQYTVRSTTVKFIAYDPSSRHMKVTFEGGDKADPIYDYGDVPPEEVAKLMFSESIGSHLSKHFRGKYKAPNQEKSFSVIRCPICKGEIAGAVNPPSIDFIEETRGYWARGFVLVPNAEALILNGCECQRKVDAERIKAGNS